MTNHLSALALALALAAIANCARSQADPVPWKQFLKLTATQKVKRSAIAKLFAGLVEEMYA